MTDALTGSPKREPTLTEQANAPRIGRARFIGNAIGYLVLFAIGTGVLMLIGSRVPSLMETISLPTAKGDVHVLNRGIQLTLIALFLAAVGELAIRRRHDRGRSSIDVLVWLELVLGDAVLNFYGPPVVYGLWITGALAVAGLYFLVVLCILPGTKGPNRYGPDWR